MSDFMDDDDNDDGDLPESSTLVHVHDLRRLASASAAPAADKSGLEPGRSSSGLAELRGSVVLYVHRSVTSSADSPGLHLLDFVPSLRSLVHNEQCAVVPELTEDEGLVDVLDKDDNDNEIYTVCVRMYMIFSI